MMDSPVGVAAWLLDKFVSWSDLRPQADQGEHQARQLENVYTRHQLLSNIMIYLVTKSFNSASWYYLAYFSGPTGMPAGSRITVPAGIANFAHELITFPPRSLVDKVIRSHNGRIMSVAGISPPLRCRKPLPPTCRSL